MIRNGTLRAAQLQTPEMHLSTQVRAVARPRSSSLSTSSPGSQYWNANIPEASWTPKCPDFLLGQSAKNVAILLSKQQDVHLESWSDIQEIVGANRIDLLQRTPAELRRYLKFCYDLKKEYGSVLTFIQHKRLYWRSPTPSGDDPFKNPDDYKVLFNDWPYAIEPDISHLVVWTKFLIAEDPSTGDLTEHSRRMLENFVKRTFCEDTVGAVPREHVVWFKNWASLKSVHALEHFHVMLFKAPKEFLAKVTGGDQPMSEKLSV